MKRGLIAALVAASVALPAGASPCGDITADGSTNVADAVAILRRAVGLEPTTPADLLAADLAPPASIDETTVPPTATPRPDGVLDVADVVQALRVSVGLSALPGCLPAAARLPHLGFAMPYDLCDGATVTAWITNLDGLPLGETRWSLGSATLVSERIIPGGVERTVILGSVAGSSSGTLSVDGALGSERLFMRSCDAPPMLVGTDGRDVAPGVPSPLRLWGDNLLCAEAAHVRGADGILVEAAITSRVHDRELGILVPPGPWPPGDSLEILVTTDCGVNPNPRPSVDVLAVAPTLPDATSIRSTATGLPSQSTTETSANIVIEGTSLDTVDHVRLGDRQYVNCPYFEGHLTCALTPPADIHSSVADRVSVESPDGADATPLEFVWMAVPSPRCGDVRLVSGTAGTAGIVEVIGEHLQTVTTAHIGGEDFVGGSADGRILTLSGMLPTRSGEYRVYLGIPDPWDDACSLRVSIGP